VKNACKTLRLPPAVQLEGGDQAIFKRTERQPEIHYANQGSSGLSIRLLQPLHPLPFGSQYFVGQTLARLFWQIAIKVGVKISEANGFVRLKLHKARFLPMVSVFSCGDCLETLDFFFRSGALRGSHGPRRCSQS
jgi:hypothetical protein